MSPKRHDPSGGEQIDRAVEESVRLAHRALERFPDLVRRHKFIAGGAAVSTSLIVLAGVAIARRMRQGQTPDQAVASVTEAEVQGEPPPEPEVEAVLHEEAEAAAEGATAEGLASPPGANVQVNGTPAGAASNGMPHSPQTM